jgi:hypothetical protein
MKRFKDLRRGDVIKVKAQDSAYNIIYKDEVNFNNPKRIADILFYLEKYGAEISEAINIYLSNSRNPSYFDSA